MEIRFTWMLTGQLEIPIPGQSRRPEIVLDNEYRNSGVPRNHNRSSHSWFGEHHVITFDSNTAESIGLENFDKLFIRGRAKLWHARTEAERLPAVGERTSGWRPVAIAELEADSAESQTAGRSAHADIAMRRETRDREGRAI